MVQNALECVIIPPKIKMRRSTYELADGGHVPGVPAGQFAYFQTLSNPYVGVTVQVDVTELAVWCRERGTSFFLAVLYAAVRAANGVPELRRRIRGDQVVEYDRCPSSHTVALPDGTYCYCSLEVDRPFREFLPYAAAEQERVKAAPPWRTERTGRACSLSPVSRGCPTRP